MGGEASRAELLRRRARDAGGGEVVVVGVCRRALSWGDEARLTANRVAALILLEDVDNCQAADGIRGAAGEKRQDEEE